MDHAIAERVERRPGIALDQDTALALARGLGWFSIGLGLAECLAPRAVARSAGLEGKERLIQAFGVREIATGLGALLSRDPAPWIWGRVAGDFLDIGTLSVGLHSDNPGRTRTGVSMLALAPVAALDVVCANALSRGNGTASGRRQISYSDRSGFPAAPSQMRGAALADFTMPQELRTPEPLKAWV